MPSRYLSDAELARLSGYPAEVADEDLIAYFTLSGADRRWVRERHRGPANRLGLALQLTTLPWLGFIPADLAAAPAAAVARLAGQLDVDPAAIAGYGGWREETRREHRREVLARLGWRTAGTGELKLLDEFLLARAMEHDAPTLLLRLACDWLHGERIVRPALDPLSRRVAAAREAAQAETYQRLAALLDLARGRMLDRLLEPDPQLGSSRLVWLRRGATATTTEAFRGEAAKLAFLTGELHADRLDLSMLPAGRRRYLAGIGRRSTAQALAWAEVTRRHPVLLATVTEAYVEVLDELVAMFDQALVAADGRARHALTERLAERARADEDRGRLLDELLTVLTDPAVPDGEVGTLIRTGVGMARLHAAVRAPADRPERDHGHLALLAARYKHLRTFTPAVLDALPLAGGHDTADLLTAVEVLRELNRTGRVRVPEFAPTSFVPARWRGYLDASRRDGHGAAHRHYWELGVLYGLQAGLRAGDVWVPGSRRHTDPGRLLLPAEQWAGRRDDFCALTGVDPDPQVQLARHRAALEAALDALEPVLAGTGGPARLDEHGELVVSPLPAEQAPAGATELADAAAALLPRVDLPGLLIEVDRWTGFTDELTHAGGGTNRPAELRRNLLAAVLAAGCNLGPAGMAHASGISEDTLAWTGTWYLREDTLRAANSRLVDAHHRLPLPQAWGGGTLSSSDGQRFPQRGRSLTARAISRYFVDEGVTTYTHVADQHSTYGTKVIPSTVRDAVYVLDEILGNPTELPIAEHATDTAGQTLAVFALFDLLGLWFSPRIRDLTDLRLHRFNPSRTVTARWPHAGPLLTQPIQTDLIVEHWDELLRLAGTMKFGHNPASLLITRLHAGARRNTVARALHEHGRLVRTVFALRYLTDLELRRRVQRQLNKGESLHALRRRLFFGHQGHVRRRHLDDQLDQALCLTLLTNAAIL